MDTRNYTIGEIARRCGLSTRTVRFYADAGLLSPGRSAAGYRLFDDRDVVALDLVRVLREAGAGLDAIGAVLSGAAGLAEVLALRLAEVEAHIRDQKRVAATLRAALKAGAPTIDDIRRVSEMIRLSQSERQATVAAFFDEVTEGLVFDPRWKETMIGLGAPDLPEEASPEQIDAWLALNALFDDPRLRRTLRAQAADTGRTRDFLRVRDDRAAYFARYDAINERIKAAMKEGATPGSPKGEELADAYIAFLAWNRGLPDSEAFRANIRDIWVHGETIRRFWELVGILNGRPESDSDEYLWIAEATARRLEVQSRLPG